MKVGTMPAPPGLIVEAEATVPTLSRVYLATKHTRMHHVLP